MKFAVPSLDLNLRLGELVAGGQRPALTPIQADDTPAPSIEAQVAAVRNAAPKPPRANAQAALPPSGRQRGGAPKADVVTGEIMDQPPASTTEWASSQQLNAIRRLLNANHGIRDDEGLCAKVSEIVGRSIDDVGKITEAEAERATEVLGSR